MIGNEIHIVQYHPPINWGLLWSDLISGRTSNKTLERYSLNLIYTLVSCSDRTIDSLSRVFSRIISNEFQSNIVLRKLGFFVSSRLNEKLYKIDVCLSSRRIYQCIIDLWLKSDKEFESISSNITKNEIRRNSHQDTEQIFYSQLNTSFINILRNIIKKCGDVNKNITIWSIIPENNMELKSTLESIEDDTTSIKIIEGLLNICLNDLQREFFNLRNIKINLVLIIKYSNALLSISNDKRPIIVANQNNHQIKISCIDSRCLLSYSDVIIANSLNLLTLRLDFSNLFFGGNAILTLFAEKNNYLLNYVDSNTCNNEHIYRKIDSTNLSDSEEGEVVEQENIITIMEDEFQKKGWIKLVDNISMKIIGFVPPHWSPTAIKLFPLTSPVGRNSFKLLKEVYHSLNFGSILLGINDIPSAALIINFFKMKNINYDKVISKNDFIKQISEIKRSCDNGRASTSFKRNLFNLVIINRKPIIPLPISRKFQCENKINMTININISQIDDKYILFASGKFQELFHKVETAIDLNIHIKKNIYCMVDFCNLQKKTKYLDTILTKKLNFSQEICNSIKIIMTSLPSLLTEFEYFISKRIKSQDEICGLKDSVSNLEDEKEHFESKFCVRKSKLVDFIFPNINGIERKMVFNSFLKTKINNCQSNKIQDSQLLVSKLDKYFSLLLGELPMNGCLFSCKGINSEIINAIISDREFVMQSVPKLFWLSIYYLINSMKYISREHQRIFYIISSGKDFEPSIHLEIPNSKNDNLFQVIESNDCTAKISYVGKTLSKIDKYSKFDSTHYCKRLNFE
ncbi:putative low complexity [Cryptosporidium sp. chipmunk genotype I]|uniref:putative low complexity n=1 Tax=Cryptosporidium sp. chipmunk genotype I TaxID=1280935 RepID=UPI00351A1B9B|nr:putative low complexity [Cryptosporidium sp. chipmunk genotype I]